MVLYLNLSSVNKFTINWDLNNNGLYQFSFNLNTAPWYVNFSNASQNFNESSPEISLSGTGIDGLDGDYYATIDNGNFVLVADGYTIYFSNSTSLPDCDSSGISAKNPEELLSLFTMYPNPAITYVSIKNGTDLKDSIITITDLNGREIRSLSVTESTTNVDVDLFGVETGLYLVRIFHPSGLIKLLKLIVE